MTSAHRSIGLLVVSVAALLGGLWLVLHIALRPEPNVLRVTDRGLTLEGDRRIATVSLPGGTETERAAARPPATSPSVQPTWTEDDSAFEKKYEGFSDDAMREAIELITTTLTEEQEAWIPRRLREGDYVDITDQSEVKGDGRSVQIATVKQCIEEGQVRSYLFKFPEDEYPMLYYRARERAWLTIALYERGVDVSHPRAPR